MLPESLDFVAVPLTLVAALLLTPLVRWAARRWGMVSRPRADRWAKKPTALMGGVAIFASVMLACFALNPAKPEAWAVVGASTFLFLVGLIDDVCRLKPYQKLIGQIMGAALVILGGLTLPWTGSSLVNMGLTVFWLVGITNAVNLLDNMDGLAAGVSAIASGFLAANFFASGQVVEGFLVSSFTASLVGFLVYNFNPASVFMGDCGSMFIGFFLASAALMHVSGGRSQGLFAVLAAPVLLLVIPIFDTTLVTVLRKLAGRAVSQGGRDHTSHRLVALGLSERWAVGLLYGLAALSGLMGVVVRRFPPDVSMVLILAFTVVMTFLGIHLAGVKVYEQNEAPARPLVAFLVDLSYKRRIFEVLLDVVLIGVAYYAANIFFFGPLPDAEAQRMLTTTLPLLVFLKLATFLMAGVYRGLWKYISMSDLLVYVQAVAASSGVCLLVFLFLYRFQGFSRVVFVLDGMLLLGMVCASRGVFRILRSLLPLRGIRQGSRVLIYGAGDAGELLLREMRNNPELQSAPVGFADDDYRKKGKKIHGLRVFGGNGSLVSICREQRIDVVLISSPKFSDDRVCEILRDCETAGVKLKRLRIVIEAVDGGKE